MSSASASTAPVTGAETTCCSSKRFSATTASSLEEALTEEIINVAVEKALEKHRAGHGAQLDRRAAIERELSLIEAYEGNLLERSPKAIPWITLLKKLKVKEARRPLTKDSTHSMRPPTSAPSARYDLNVS